MHFGPVGRIERQHLAVWGLPFVELGVDGIVAELIIFDEVPKHVDAEAVDTLPKPEPHHIVDRLTNVRIAPVEIRLRGKKCVIVVLPARFIERPGAPAEFR